MDARSPALALWRLPDSPLMRVLAIVHQQDAGPGVFADAIRAHGAHLDLWPYPEDRQPRRGPRDHDAVLTFGGAMHPDQDEQHSWLAEEKALLAELLDRHVPVLGVCLGAQLLAEAAGASARRAREPEIGWYEVEVLDDAAEDPLLAPLRPRFTAFGWHSYEFPPPPLATPLARSATCLQAYRIADFAWGIQFHAEVTGADVEAWIDDRRSDPDAVGTELDWHELRERTRASIGAWNELGRGLCERFLDAATRA
jgi:GMP synthase (glutamine-hydrolysing)